ncbi:unnamed protein product [Hymenolepis diminuta]|uniref:Importin subunit alpha n=1 Tax=Hymenolepis diminuta TaxID=6216 RepID=A0A564ZD04_HYMDI|nr:unnamed protein product [Hymenolepis diminuta]
MNRSRLYKYSGKDEELRRRRNDQSVELRKVRKEQQLLKRRNVLVDLEETSPLREQMTAQLPLDYEKVVADLNSLDVDVVSKAAMNCRKILSKMKNPPIEELVNLGAHRTLTKLLDMDNNNIVFEAAWALTNIASGESKHTKAVVECNSVPKLIELLDHSDIRIAEQSIWALGNIAGEGPSYRDMLIKVGIVTPALRLLQRSWGNSGVVSNIAWVLSNLCRNNNPSPPRSTVLELIPVFVRLFDYAGNEDIIIDTAWAISYITDCGDSYVEDILQSGCIPCLVKCLDTDIPRLVSPALRSLGNLILGTDEQTQRVLDYGLLEHVAQVLVKGKSTLVKESCWLISNVTAGTKHQIQMVIDAGIVPMLLKWIREGDFRVQREACWAISNIAIGGNPEQQAALLNLGIFNALSDLLKVSDAKLVGLVLEVIKKLFETAEEHNQLEICCVALEESEALTHIEALQEHENDEIYKAAYEFISKYFSGGEEEEQGTEAVPVQNQISGPSSNEFTFQPPTQSNNEFDF